VIHHAISSPRRRKKTSGVRGKGWWRERGWAVSAAVSGCWEPGGGTSASSQIENSTGSPRGGWFTRTRSLDWGPFTSMPRWSKVKGEGLKGKRADLSIEGEGNRDGSRMCRFERTQWCRDYFSFPSTWLRPVNKNVCDERATMIFNARRNKRIVFNFSLPTEEIRALNLVIKNSAIKNKDKW